MNLAGYPVLLVMAIAVLASLLSEVRIGVFAVPVVVWEMVFGMCLGPNGLNVVHENEIMQWFGHRAGLAALFFMAGLDLDLEKVKGRPFALALRGWALSLGIGFAAVSALHFSYRTWTSRFGWAWC